MDSASNFQQNPRDCVHFLRTGTCRFGPNCRFNHPDQVLDSTQATFYPAQAVEFPERIGQPDCQFYLKTGTCKFGAQCKYHHPRVKPGSARGPPLLNCVGLPMRPGENECAYYNRTGSCKYGVACKFHHPNPAVMGYSPLPSYPGNAPAPVPAWQSVYLPSSGWPGSSPYMTMYPLSTQSIHNNGGWASYQGVGTPLSNGDHRLFYNGAQQQMVGTKSSFAGLINDSPRLELQDCKYFVQTGHCKFGASCKYQHPKNVAIPMVTAELSPMGLPLRPGHPLCAFYDRNGICKFGPVCRYDHPMRGPSVPFPSLPLNEMVKGEEKSTPFPENNDGNNRSVEAVDACQDGQCNATDKTEE